MELGDECGLESRMRFLCAQIMSRRHRHSGRISRLTWYDAGVKENGVYHAFTFPYYGQLFFFSFFFVFSFCYDGILYSFCPHLLV